MIQGRFDPLSGYHSLRTGNARSIMRVRRADSHFENLSHDTASGTDVSSRQAKSRVRFRVC